MSKKRRTGCTKAYDKARTGKKTVMKNLDEHARYLLQQRYLLRDGMGKLAEEPVDLFWRVAQCVAACDHAQAAEERSALAERFFTLMAGLDFLPNSPCLMNAGTSLQQLSACFVLPVEDSMEGIFDAVKQAAIIHKSGGGTGFSFSRIRPASDQVRSTQGVSSGPVSFMQVFDAATETIKQGGKRRGANMAVLRVDHPDILDFIRAKSRPGRLNNFNLSVALTPAFLHALEHKTDYDLVNPRTGTACGQLPAQDVFALMVREAHASGEPGILFLERINRDNPVPHLGDIESTNPCGEQPLLPYESCILGSVNLAHMVKPGAKAIDWDKLEKVVRLAVRFLDNVIDANQYPLEQIARATRLTRKIGLGVMGFADLLYRLSIPYDSERALALAEDIMGRISNWARKASGILAEQRGPFPAWEKSRRKQDGPIRNATVTTIAPTGSISMIAGCSSGIEPVFSLAYERHVLGNKHFKEVHPYFMQQAEAQGFFRPDLAERILASGSIQDFDFIPPSTRQVFVTALDIAPQWHIKMQAAFQRHTDNAVSKTVNLPQDCSRQDVAAIFLQAHALDVKGVTVFRQNSRAGQVLRLKGTAGRAEPQARDRPDVTDGTTTRVRTGCGNLYITVNRDPRGLAEVFIRMGKSGGCISSYTEALGRLISLALRCGIPVASIVEQLAAIRCPSPFYGPDGLIASCADAISRVLAKNGQGNGAAAGAGEKDAQAQVRRADVIATGFAPECPECHGVLIMEANCLYCPACGWSKCP